MKNLQTQFVILLAFLLAFYLRFDSLELSAAYVIVLLLGLLVSAVIMPATGAFRHEFRWAFLRRSKDNGNLLSPDLSGKSAKERKRDFLSDGRGGW